MRWNNIEKYIENKCDDVESSKEWINIITLDLIQGEYDIEKLLKNTEVLIHIESCKKVCNECNLTDNNECK